MRRQIAHGLRAARSGQPRLPRAIRLAHAQLTPSTDPPSSSFLPHSPSATANRSHDLPDPSSFPLYRPLAQEPYPSDADPMYVSNASLKARLTAQMTEGLAELDEESLRSFYAAVVESGAEHSGQNRLGIEAPADPRETSTVDVAGVLGRLEQRLLGTGELDIVSADAGSSLAHRRIASLLERLLPSPASTSSRLPVPLGLVGSGEWTALLREATTSGDVQGAKKVLLLMQAHGTPIEQNHVEPLIELHASAGRTDAILELISTYPLSQDLTPEIHGLIIRSHLCASPPRVDPAIDILKYHESISLPLPQSSYNVVLSHLTTSTPTHQPTSHTRALAWDLFAHMRLVAHPDPSREMYRTMIRSCATAADPQPERARDLWIEMTSQMSAQKGTEPDRDDYDAIIRALSSTKKDYLEAFDLLRQMLAKHKDATFKPFEDEPVERWSRFAPTVETFSALLEGTKRAGDLGRARWVLNECLRLIGSSDGHLGRVNEELMSGVFMTYASWTPLVRPGRLRESREGDETGSIDKTTPVHDTAEDVLDNLADSASLSAAPNEQDSLDITSETEQRARPPMTSADALREATALFDLILHDVHHANGPFSAVRLTPRLINSYLSVHLAHASSLTTARETWDGVWSRAGAIPNGWSYLQVLERCARGGLSPDERRAAQRWGEAIWAEYSQYAGILDASAYVPHDARTTQGQQPIDSLAALMPQTGHGPAPLSDKEAYNAGLGPRQVERAYRAKIRLLTLSGEIDAALSLVRDFHQRYPPDGIVRGYEPFSNAGLMIRAVDTTAIAEPHIPPHLIFSDIDVLHQRLVRDERWKDVGWLSWAIKSWEGALKRRRRMRVKGVGRGRTRRLGVAERPPEPRPPADSPAVLTLQ